MLLSSPANDTASSRAAGTPMHRARSTNCISFTPDIMTRRWKKLRARTHATIR